MTRARKSPASIEHEAATVASLKRDPTFAAAYLDAVLADGDQSELLLAMRRLCDATGGVQALAERTGLNATTLYRTLSADGNPELRTLRAMLGAMGLRLSVTPVE